MKILHYTQHVLGIGHLFRSLAIDSALAPATVHLITGGPEIPLTLPDNVCHHAMPALKMDADFQQLQALSPTMELDTIWQIRTRTLLALYEELQPDLLLIEMFPFGRKRFARELLPLLKHNQQQVNPVPVLCSVRDILVEKDDPDAFEHRVLHWLNTYFAGVLVHADPELIPLEATFSRILDIKCPLWYTGYVTQSPTVATAQAARHALGIPLADTALLASAGSGSVGGELLQACVVASIQLSTSLAHRLQLFTGPYLPQPLRTQLEHTAAPHSHITLATFTDRFTDYMLASDLSLSMGGYNTTMNLLACGTPGLLHPFVQNREQRMRLQALSRKGYLGLLEPKDLDPTILVQRIKQRLYSFRTPSVSLRLQGDQESAAIIRRLLGNKE